jgi:predicted dehydrogenase
MVRVAIVGAGRWGINHVRAFGRIPSADVRAVCDGSDAALEKAHKLVPGARLEKSYEAVLAAPDVDAVVLATPAKDHAHMALAALAAKKHVLVEKPLALRGEDAVAVADAAEREGRVLMVGHLLLFHPVVQRMREAILAGEIGDILYLYAIRVNLGTLRRDENAMWSLAPHDISVMLHLLGDEPKSVAARGAACLQRNVQDVVFVSLRFKNGVLGQIQNSWLDPRKERRIVVVGSKKMMEFDDVHPTEKLRIHDKGYDREPAWTEYAEYLSIRNGEVHVPQVAMIEPLDAECRHFLECVEQNKRPLTDGRSAVDVVKVLEAAQKSLLADGVPTILD